MHVTCSEKFKGIYAAQQWLEGNSNKARDAAKTPGRLLLLSHALHLLQQHPNMKLCLHPASEVVKVCCAVHQLISDGGQPQGSLS
jgi:hypothetical protein